MERAAEAGRDIREVEQSGRDRALFDRRVAILVVRFADLPERTLHTPVELLHELLVLAQAPRAGRPWVDALVRHCSPDVTAPPAPRRAGPDRAASSRPQAAGPTAP